MSARAAWRLESLLFDRVYDYAGGKDDWLSHGLPVEGEMAEDGLPTAGELARRDVPTCRYTDRLSNVSRVLVSGAGEECVVQNGSGIVLGRLSGDDLADDPDTTVDRIMEPGPSTIRPGTPLLEISERMEAAQVGRVLVTTAEGRFVGVLYLEDAKEKLS